MWAPSAAIARASTLATRRDTRSSPRRRASTRPVPAAAGDEYRLVVDGAETLPDPCSRAQPHGVRGPSAIVDTGAFSWTDESWEGVALDDLVVYELHVGAFTEEGTFDAVIPRLRGLRELGVTAIELMPVATFPGERGWGYDGLYVDAPHRAYGGPKGCARLVDAAHAEGLAVLLDVVYNHVGPGQRGADRVRAVLHEPAHAPSGATRSTTSEQAVREWAIQNAELWVRDYHVDGLRLDAVHAIFDDSPLHICAELATRVRAARPGALVISEMQVGDWRPIEEWGHDAQWADGLHHDLHVLLTGEQDGYYAGFGSVGTLAEAVQGQGHDPRRLVVFAQNHDQVGNRAVGDRLPPDAARRSRPQSTLFSPCTPLLFMGEESFEPQPVPVLHRPHRPGDRRGDARGPQARSSRRSRRSPARRCPTRRPSRRSCARSSRQREPDPLVPRAARAAPRSCRASSRWRPTRTRRCCACAAATSSSSRTSARSR